MFVYLKRYKVLLALFFIVALVSFYGGYDSNDPDYLEAHNNLIGTNGITTSFTDQTPLTTLSLVDQGSLHNYQNRTVNPQTGQLSLVDTFTVNAPGAPNNGGSAGWAMFLDLITGASSVVVTQMSTANTGTAGAVFSVEIFTRDGTALGGPVGSGPGSSPAGWTSLGTVPATQGAVGSGISLVFNIPPITVAANDTVGVAIKFNTVGPRYLGSGSPPYSVFTDGTLTVVTGDGRSAPFTTTGSWFASRALTGVVRYVLNTPPTPLPDLLYYKFERNPTPATVINCGTPGVGTPIAPVVGATLTPGGQFDSCVTNTGLTSSGVTTGYNWNTGTSSWTISMWLTIPTTASIGYIFGDPGASSFRCFHNGVAGADNLLVRFTAAGGASDVLVTGIGPNPTVVTVVYDSAAAQVRAYKNGVLATTVGQTLNMTGGTGFKVAGYSTSAGILGKIDEFRLYKRALTPAEITATYNTDIGDCIVTGISGNNNQIPGTYRLEQNYPNPFNPTTNIKFGLPNSGVVKLVVFDVLGREVTTLVNEFKTAGQYVVDFDASMYSSGVYFYRIESGNFIETKKMLLVK